LLLPLAIQSVLNQLEIKKNYLSFGSTAYLYLQRIISVISDENNQKKKREFTPEQQLNWVMANLS